MEIYTVFVYRDYRKEVEMEILRAFPNYEKALFFAQQFTHEKDYEADYVSVKAEYDKLMLFKYYEDMIQFRLDKGEITEEEINDDEKKYEEKIKELGKYFRDGYWTGRIAIAKTFYETDS